MFAVCLLLASASAQRLEFAYQWAGQPPTLLPTVIRTAGRTRYRADLTGQRQKWPDTPVTMQAFLRPEWDSLQTAFKLLRLRPNAPLSGPAWLHFFVYSLLSVDRLQFELVGRRKQQPTAGELSSLGWWNAAANLQLKPFLLEFGTSTADPSLATHT